MPRFAAIDVGSNASRLRVVDADAPHRARDVAVLRIPVRLGHAVFLTGKLDEDTIEEAVDALRRFAEILDDEQVVRYRAVVTASAREADNGEELLGRVRRETGIALESIDGAEEARLVQLAVRRRMPLDSKRALLVDLGGGSLEVSEVRGDDTRFSTSLEVGTVRLLESFLTEGRAVTRDQQKLLVEYLERMLASVAQTIGRKRYDVVVGTGGNFEAIATLCGVEGASPPAIDVTQVEALLPTIASMTPAERRAAYKLRADRADVIVPALYVVQAVGHAARAMEITVPGVGLKDGIVAELVEKHFRVWDYRGEENVAANAAVHLGRHYQFDEAHATQVERLAYTLFDALAPLHKLQEHDRLLLRLAALLHDVGAFIDFAGHHKHTQYIIEHSDLMGLAPAERLIVGCVARYHRRALPAPTHASFKKLGPKDRVRVRKLSAILRIADALDREHRSKVQSVRVRVDRDKVTLRIHGDGDISLETWTLRRKASLFEKTFQRVLKINVG